MPLHKITQADFSVITRGSTRVLKVKKPGPMLLCYISSGKPGAQEMLSILSSISKNIPNVLFGVCDLAVCRSIITDSRQSTTPIQSVPTLIFYIDGMPYNRYTGRKLPKDIHEYLVAIVASTSNTAFVPSKKSKGSGSSHNQKADNLPKIQMDPEKKLMLPEGVIPHNLRWREDIFNMAGDDD